MKIVRGGGAAALVCLALGCSSEDGGQSGPADGSVSDSATGSLSVVSVEPRVVDPSGGSTIVITGTGLSAVTAVRIGTVDVASFVVLTDTTLRAQTPALQAATGLDLVMTAGAGEASLLGALDAWSPTELTGARVFDAAHGVAASEEATSYQWIRLTADLGEAWRARDGLTVNWFPATGKYWMVAGWNPFVQPEGFPSAEGIYPPESTTNEVWSSLDGVTWTQELAHLNNQFDPRHSHGTVVWQDKLWMIGGDHHLGRYNHDVVSSADGVQWTVEVNDPPWAERAFSVMGVYDDKLWMIGGQDAVGAPSGQVHHNDVWSSVDGRTWGEVAPDEDTEDGNATRFSGRGVVNNIVEFQGRMWLVGGARYNDGEQETGFQEVWSSDDGRVWMQHAVPAWPARIWADVRVWDDKIWLLFGSRWGYGNVNDVWYSADGEHWTELEPGRSPPPPSHGQGIAVTDDALLYVGGNYNWNNYPMLDKSAWSLQRFRGALVDTWTDRGLDGLAATGTGTERPLRIADAFGEGKSGIRFSGASALNLEETDHQAEGRSVFWVARSPWMATPAGWDEELASANPLWTVVGDGDAQACAAGFDDGTLSYRFATAAGWDSYSAGTALQKDAGEVRLVGITHASNGAIQGYVDGAAVGEAAEREFDDSCGFSRLGAGGYVPVADTGYRGTIGAIVVVPAVLDAEDVERLHAWAQGRFGAL